MHFSGYPDDNVLQSWTSSSVTITLQRQGNVYNPPWVLEKEYFRRQIGNWLLTLIVGTSISNSLKNLFVKSCVLSTFKNICQVKNELISNSLT
jgi:hypothetical protein